MPAVSAGSQCQQSASAVIASSQCHSNQCQHSVPAISAAVGATVSEPISMCHWYCMHGVCQQHQQSAPAVSAGSQCRQSVPAVIASRQCQQCVPAVSAGSQCVQSVNRSVCAIGIACTVCAGSASSQCEQSGSAVSASGRYQQSALAVSAAVGTTVSEPISMCN